MKNKLENYFNKIIGNKIWLLINKQFKNYKSYLNKYWININNT